MNKIYHLRVAYTVSISAENNEAALRSTLLTLAPDARNVTINTTGTQLPVQTPEPPKAAEPVCAVCDNS